MDADAALTPPAQVERVAVVSVGDLHCGSTVAICPPRVTLDEGGTYEASRGQRWLWQRWNDFWRDISTETQGYRHVLILNGDLIELDAKRRSYQVISRNSATILEATRRVLEPALDWCSEGGLFALRGTEAHVGKSASGEEILINDVDEKYVARSDDGTATWWHVRRSAAGVRFDAAHHAAMGNLPWSERNAALKLATMAAFQYANLGQPAPDVLLRSHVHRYSDSGQNWPTFAVTLPAWQLSTAFAYRIGAENRLADIGGLLFRCENGKYQYDKVLYKPRQGILWNKTF